jgi:hypothetical protein
MKALFFDDTSFPKAQKEPCDKLAAPSIPEYYYHRQNSAADSKYLAGIQEPTPVYGRTSMCKDTRNS